MKLAHFLDNIHQNLAKSHCAVNLAVKLSNQCHAIIKYHLGESKDLEKNGESWLAKQIAPHSSTFIDVGANLGEWSEIFYNHISDKNKCKGLLFDPSPLAFKNLQTKFKDTATIELINVAVSDKSGQMTFYENPDHFARSSLVDDVDNPNAVKTTINVTTLDEEINKRKLEYIDFLKIDAEGYDLHVMRGASNLISKQQIGIIQFEYIGAWAGASSTLVAALNLLNSSDYQVFLLKSSGLNEFDYHLYREYFSYSNFVAVSPANMSLLDPLIR